MFDNIYEIENFTKDICYQKWLKKNWKIWIASSDIAGEIHQILKKRKHTNFTQTLS